MTKRALVFMPTYGIDFFSDTLAYFSRKLVEHGYVSDLISCGGLLNNFCNTYSAAGMDYTITQQQKDDICKKCILKRKIASRHYNQIQILENLVSKDDFSEIEKKLSEVYNDEIETIYHDGLPIGRFASYEFIINLKLSTVNPLTPELRKKFINTSLRNSLIVYFAMKKLLLTESYSLLLVSNSNYGLEALACEMIKRQGGVPVSIAAGFNLNRLANSCTLAIGNHGRSHLDTMDYFRENYDSIDIDYGLINYPLEHLSSIWSSKTVHTYSSAKDDSFLSSQLFQKIKKFKKLVLLSMSSGDEAYASNFATNGLYFKNYKSTFENRAEWLESINQFFKEKTDYLVVIRFHPREFPNKREGVTSEEALRLVNIFKDSPANFHVNTPDEKISIYDLLPLVDLHLCAQTTVGLEGAILGIPTITHVDGIGGYPLGFIVNYFNTKNEYFENISKVLLNESFFDPITIEKSLAWYIFLYSNSVYNFESSGFLYHLKGWRRWLKLALHLINPYIYQRMFFKLYKDDERKFEKFVQSFNKDWYKIPIKDKSNDIQFKDAQSHIFFIELLNLFFNLNINKDNFSKLTYKIDTQNITSKILIEKDTLFFSYRNKTAQSIVKFLKIPSEKS